MEYYKLNDIQKRDFYKIYKELFSNEEYMKISAEAKWAYVILIDKLDKPKTDDEGNLYLTSIREEMQKLLNLSVNTVTKVFRELVIVNLISESKPGFGELKRTYIKKLENVDIDQTHKDSENVVDIEKLKIVEIKSNTENQENKNKSKEIIIEKIEDPIKKTLIEKFTFDDIEVAKSEVNKTAFLKSNRKLNKILENIEIKSFWGNDFTIISMAIELIVKDAYQDERTKNIKKLNNYMVKQAVLKCKSERRFAHTIVIKVLINEILDTLEEETQN